MTRPESREFNPMKQVPAPILDDGAAIAETVAICRYFEGVKPAPDFIRKALPDEE